MSCGTHVLGPADADPPGGRTTALVTQGSGIAAFAVVSDTFGGPPDPLARLDPVVVGDRHLHDEQPEHPTPVLNAHAG